MEHIVEKDGMTVKYTLNVADEEGKLTDRVLTMEERTKVIAFMAGRYGYRVVQRNDRKEKSKK